MMWLSAFCFVIALVLIRDGIKNWPRRSRRLEMLTGLPPYHAGGRKWPRFTDMTVWR